MLREDSPLRSYLEDEQMDLVESGYHIIEHVNQDRDHKFSDYSFIVFPFAKAYEGFLKKVFLDAGYITRKDYLSKHFRVGKVMSPNLRKRLGRDSVYKKICDSVGCELSEKIWKTWTRGRNQVFHYFPDNLRSLTLHEAEEIVDGIVTTMETVVLEVKIQEMRQRLSKLSFSEVKKLRGQKEKI